MDYSPKHLIMPLLSASRVLFTTKAKINTSNGNRFLNLSKVYYQQFVTFQNWLLATVFTSTDSASIKISLSSCQTVYCSRCGSLETRLLFCSYDNNNVISLIYIFNIPAKEASIKGTKKRSGTKHTEPTKEAYLNMEVCAGANIYKTGEDPAIKEDSEYPDWLWGLLEPKKSHDELSPDSKQYWRRYNKHKAHERNAMMERLG